MLLDDFYHCKNTSDHYKTIINYLLFGLFIVISDNRMEREELQNFDFKNDYIYLYQYFYETEQVPKYIDTEILHIVSLLNHTLFKQNQVWEYQNAQELAKEFNVSELLEQIINEKELLEKYKEIIATKNKQINITKYPCLIALPKMYSEIKQYIQEKVSIN